MSTAFDAVDAIIFLDFLKFGTMLVLQPNTSAFWLCCIILMSDSMFYVYSTFDTLLSTENLERKLSK